MAFARGLDVQGIKLKISNLEDDINRGNDEIKVIKDGVKAKEKELNELIKNKSISKEEKDLKEEAIQQMLIKQNELEASVESAIKEKEHNEGLLKKNKKNVRVDDGHRHETKEN